MKVPQESLPGLLATSQKISTGKNEANYCVEICHGKNVFFTKLTTEEKSMCFVEFSGKMSDWES